MKRLIRNNGIIFLFLVSALAVLFLSIFTGRMNGATMAMLEGHIRQRLVNVAQSAAHLATAEELNRLVEPRDMADPLYSELKQRLADFCAEYDVLFAYYLRPYGGGQLEFVVDNDSNPETMVGLGDVVDMEPAPAEALGGTASAAGLGDYSENWDGILAAYAPVYDATGRVYCVAGVDVNDTDIVEARNLAQRLAAAQIAAVVLSLLSGAAALLLYHRKARQSEAASVAKSQFLQRMSHEIRTPMNAIIGLCRMAKASDDPAQVSGYLDTIKASSGHLLSLINDILDLTKIENGKTAEQPCAIDLREETQAIAGIVAPQMADREQTFTLELDDALPPCIFCDAAHISQIVVNLLSNASKFTPSGGKIGMRVQLAERRGNACRLEWRVKDNGIGISPEFLGKLFDPFEQEDGGSTREYGGTGLGLAIAKQLAHMMDGQLTAISTLGKGSEFIFSVWVRQAAREDLAKAPQATASGRVDLTGRRVLLVEDSEINQLIAENMFAGMGAVVDVAGNGQQGLERFEKNGGRYDLIFMDVQMPVMDGYEATRRIRQSRQPGAAGVPIIAMTANVFPEDVQHALDAGMDAHVGKPFEPEHVEEAIREVLRK